MLSRLVATLLVVAAFRGCMTYEFEHEFWLRTDGSGSVYVTGRPALWTAFKNLRLDEKDVDAMKSAARRLFERSGLRVRRVTVTRHGGHVYLFVAAEFSDVNRISYTPAFPDLRISLQHVDGRLRLDGSWQRPLDGLAGGERDREGLVAVRFHLPSKVYSHRNAADGVERGNILSWREPTATALDGERLEFGALIDARSILFSTVMLFVGAVVLAVLLLSLALWAVVRRGRRDLANSS
jgi:hypothetical protein